MGIERPSGTKALGPREGREHPDAVELWRCPARGWVDWETVPGPSAKLYEVSRDPACESQRFVPAASLAGGAEREELLKEAAWYLEHYAAPGLASPIPEEARALSTKLRAALSTPEDGSDA